MENENTINIRQTKEKEALLESLKQVPIIEYACKRTGISRTTFYRWKKDDKEFAKAVEEALTEGEELITDLSENQLISLIKDKNFQAIQLWLRAHHRKYSEKIEITTNTNVKDELDEEQEKIVREAMRLATMTEEEIKAAEKSSVKKDSEEIKPENHEQPTNQQ